MQPAPAPPLSRRWASPMGPGPLASWARFFPTSFSSSGRSRVPLPLGSPLVGHQAGGHPLHSPGARGSLGLQPPSPSDPWGQVGGWAGPKEGQLSPPVGQRDGPGVCPLGGRCLGSRRPDQGARVGSDRPRLHQLSRAGGPERGVSVGYLKPRSSEPSRCIVGKPWPAPDTREQGDA